MQLHVVGALNANNDLSPRRAGTIAEPRVAAGIQRHRLIPAGVGSVVPMGSNDKNVGRILNRRVELVKRSNAR